MDFTFNEHGINIELVRITQEFADTHSEEEINQMTSNYLEARVENTLTVIPFEDMTIVKFKNGAGIYYNYEEIPKAPFLISLKEVNKIIKNSKLENIEKINRLFKNNNTKQALKLLNKATEEGVNEASYMLAMNYYNGFHLKQSYEKAFKFFKKAAKNGSIKAYCEIAKMYYFGEYVNQDYNKAFQNYLIAADKNHPKSQYSIGVALIEGEPGNIKIDIEKGLEYLQKSADQGFEGAISYLLFNGSQHYEK